MNRTHDHEMQAFIQYAESLSPFELKDVLIQMAKQTEKLGAYTFLNAGRGNPNWTATMPRQAFFSLGQFAVTECQRTFSDGALAGIPYKEGMAERFQAYAHDHEDMPGMSLLKEIVHYGIETLGFPADAWLYELVDGIMGDHYPIPSRMLPYTEEVVKRYFLQEMGGNLAEKEHYKLFAVEGGTAAMCYLFDTLSANHLLKPGDHIALMVPIFTPYLEIPQLSRYQFKVTYIYADARNEEGRHTWQYPLEELRQLEDESIKALFVVNPSNPPSVALDVPTIDYLKELVTTKRPDLMIITDDVYGTFVEDFKSLMIAIPSHTIGVYSFSKYFGVTGWRLGIICLHEGNVFDKALKKLPEDVKASIAQRYQSLSQKPEEIPFIDRIVADSRQVALNHTAGLSTPQQIQMLIFSAFALLDSQNVYKEQTKAICHKRLHLLYNHLDLPLYIQPHSSAYYREIDLLVWARLSHGEAFATFLQKHYPPYDMLYRLAKDYAIVLLNGNGFKGPDWSIRVSLANLPDEAYIQIGKAINAIFNSYVATWQASLSQNNR